MIVIQSALIPISKFKINITIEITFTPYKPFKVTWECFITIG